MKFFLKLKYSGWYFFLCFLFLILSSPYFFSYLESKRYDGIYIFSGFFLFFLSLFPWIRINCILLLMVVPAAALDSWYLISYGVRWDANVVGVMLETNRQELWEFVRGMWVIGGGITLYLVMFFVVLSLPRAIWTGRLRIYVFFLSVGLIFIPLIFSFDRFYEDKSAVQDVFGDGLRAWMYPYTDAFPFDVGIRVYSYVSQKENISNVSSLRQHFSWQLSGTRREREVYVLFIGESSRPDRWGINGYYRNTTPRLQDRKNIMFLRDVVSPYSATRLSVPLMLSNKPFSERTSLLSAFKEAGYKTFFISTQGGYGAHDNVISSYALEADKVFFMNSISYDGRGAYDEKVLDALTTVLKDEKGSVFIVVHVLGSHFNYSYRYPEGFDVFHPSLKKSDAVSLYDYDKKELFSNSYDNSILYSDFVIDSVISRLDEMDVPVFLFFSSDHGENLFDNGCAQAGHGRNNEFDFRVAALSWASDKWIKKYPQAWSNIGAHQYDELFTPNIFDTMLDVAGIRTPYSKPTSSFASSSWVASERRLSNGVDFDEAEFVGECRAIISPLKRSERERK
ncbi:phosphoethanolamine transferase [Pseudomonas sp. LRF_L74]|uniref:phosphoethanolamine transferase n=1 Tax=Pseudomonas sp. LRF_L74 TaxID=3369422 RepID=UPI003F5FF1AF